MSVYGNKIIVTGALGYIGSHLVERLLKSSHELLLVDNSTNGSYKNIKHLYPMDQLPEILNIDKLKAYPKIPLIFHLGSPSDYMMFENNKQLYPYTIKDFLTLLEYCRKWGTKLIYASSGSLYYGNSVPQNETMNIHPKDLYSECFYQMERLCELYSTYGVKSLGLRLFNVYGGREQYKGDNASIIYRFIMSLSNGESTVVYDDGMQTRDFIYIDDVIDALMVAKESKFSTDVINIGTGKNYSFNDIVEKINNYMSTNLEPKYKKNTVVNYIKHSLADTEKAEKILKFKASTTIDQGIKNVIEECLYKGIFSDEENLNVK